MKYKITYQVDFVFCWGDSRTAEIEVDLTDEEVKNIRSVVDVEHPKDTIKAVEAKYPEIYSKLFHEGLEFMWYISYLDIRLSGEWSEYLETDIDEYDLMKEDIDSGDFDPTDENGKRLRGSAKYEAWRKWEEESLNHLSFSERSHYYIDRYGIEDVNNDEISCDIYFPDEIIKPVI